MKTIASRGVQKGSFKPKEGIMNITSKTVQKQTQPKAVPSKEEELNLLISKPFKCVTCGDRFSKQKGNFPFSQSFFFKGNNSYLPICNNCFNHATDQYQELLGNQDEAIKRMCLHWDLYLSESILSSSRKIDAERSRVKEYVRQCNLIQNAGKTYDDFLAEQKNTIITSVQEAEELGVSVSKSAMERWGIGMFEEEDYKILEDHYRMLKRQNPNCDNNQEIFIKDLCYIHLRKMKAMKDSSDDFDKMVRSYRDTFKQAGLKTIQENDSSNDEVFGITLATISQYTPEEYYKDKKLYKDFDGLGDYITRFITRPLKNLMFGSHERDKEFFVKDNEDEE